MNSFLNKENIVSNDKNVFERLFRLWSAVCKMIVDGARDPGKVADDLQRIVDTVTVPLRWLFVDVEVGATDGTETFQSSGLFTGGIYGLGVPVVAQGKPTMATKAIVWEMVLDGPFILLLGDLREKRKRWTESQVVRFCRDHRDKLRKEGCGTFFELEGGVVANVSANGSGHLDVYFNSFSPDFIWRAEFAHRLVTLVSN